MKKETGFEGHLNELEEIVDKLESGEADLDLSIELYEKGMKLIDKCRDILKEKKLKIELLKKKSESGYETEPFGVDENDEKVKEEKKQKEKKDDEENLFK
jgi:exodeoxyribonuclease VII small subunit